MLFLIRLLGFLLFVLPSFIPVSAIERPDCTIVTSSSGFQKYSHKDETSNCFIFDGSSDYQFSQIKLGLFSRDGIPAYATLDALHTNDNYFFENGVVEYSISPSAQRFILSFWSLADKSYEIETSWLLLNDSNNNKILYIIADFSESWKDKHLESNPQFSRNSYSLSEGNASVFANTQPNANCTTDNTSPKNPNNHLWNLHENLSDAQDMSGVLVVSPVTALLWFANQVRENGEWDIKQHYPRNIDAENFGNFHYGATGAAMGLPLEVLTRAAGAVQELVDFRNGIYRPELDSWYGDSPYGDEVRDQQWILSGYNYYHQVYVEAGELASFTRDLCNLSNEIGDRYSESSGGSTGVPGSGGYPDSGGGFGDSPSCSEITGTGCSCGEGICVCEDQTIYSCE